jgi:hypothetical protein
MSQLNLFTVDPKQAKFEKYFVSLPHSSDMKTSKNFAPLALPIPFRESDESLHLGQSFFMENQEEIWKDVIGYEKLYQVSNTGKIKSLSRDVPFTNRWGHRITRKCKELILKPRITNLGYFRVHLLKNGIDNLHSLHRIVAKAFLQNPNNHPQVNHKDGDKSNNNDWNLEWCNNSHNQLHAYKLGLNHTASGFEDSQSKPVLHIFNGIETKYGSIKLAQKHTGICGGTIGLVIKRNECIKQGLNKGHMFVLI